MDLALARLEAAVERLGGQIARLRMAPPVESPAPTGDAAAMEDMVPRAEVAALAARLDAALATLKVALAAESLAPEALEHAEDQE